MSAFDRESLNTEIKEVQALLDATRKVAGSAVVTPIQTLIMDLTKRLTLIEEAIDEVDYRYRVYATANTPLTEAHAALKLDDAVGDLISWHPKYDSDRGEILRDEE